MFTIIGAMAELEASLISERVTAEMRALGLGRPQTWPIWACRKLFSTSMGAA